MTGVRRHDETPPTWLEPGDFGKYQGSWFVRPPDGTDAIIVRNVFAHGDHTISVELPLWVLVHGGWRRK